MEASAFSISIASADIDDFDKDDRIWPIVASLFFASSMAYKINEMRHWGTDLSVNARGIAGFTINPYLDADTWTIGCSVSKRF